MAALLADPFGRQLLSLLTADYGIPGDPGRRVLRHELQQLQLRAQAARAPRSVTLAIRAALAALRAEFSAPLPIAPLPIASGPVAPLGL
ncbi:hypothetical protein [Methylobacterium sp. WL7]|jgi:hypothetical protein|uniref:hypothetical protein n=1 Tax=Methylobacterium sp. WL7 TaxID=2603900 RepID=UPI0011C97971|nr:hypothetical protein [Methylobacterium sp. WL7]TXN40166.1 hypothetical protein FV233_27035 [Methylobacterium sp. WL7]